MQGEISFFLTSKKYNLRITASFLLGDDSKLRRALAVAFPSTLAEKFMLVGVL